MFLNDDFLLKNEWAKTLYHHYAKNQPIIDYHCHLEAQDIYENKNFNNLTQIWLNDNGLGDHYKWRLMRTNGVSEKLISGDGDDYEKFMAFVETIELAIGNPVYEWSHLELKRYFGIDLIINKENAENIWRMANEFILTECFRPKQLIRQMKVELVATTDDPISDLTYHQLLKADENSNQFKVVPTFRPDKVMAISSDFFIEYLSQLGQSAQQEIHHLTDLEQVLAQRVHFFNEVGCRLADHGLNEFYYEHTSREEVSIIFDKALTNQGLTSKEQIYYQSYIQIYLMSLYKKLDWTMQLHMNVFRNSSQINFDKIGPDSGFDSIGDQSDVSKQVMKLYKQAEITGIVPKSIWYSLNENDWMSLASLMGSFQGESQQKIQLGCAWWFNDNYDGMKKQLTIFAQQSLLGNFVGMLTDSRSFLSYPRHEYFRRILCQLIGEWVEEGRLPTDESYLGKLVSDICYGNARKKF